jgi:hypothetical protein
MSTVFKRVFVLVAVAVTAGAGGLGVMALADEGVPEVVTPRSEPAPVTPTPRSGAGAQIEADDRALWPEEARRARAAALRMTGGGRISEVDRSDDPGEAYEVEIVQGGHERDIALDADFNPVPNRRYDD